MTVRDLGTSLFRYKDPAGSTPILEAFWQSLPLNPASSHKAHRRLCARPNPPFEASVDAGGPSSTLLAVKSVFGIAQAYGLSQAHMQAHQTCLKLGHYDSVEDADTLDRLR